MKKLALALMCLVSVAFFASCNKVVDNPEPAISVITDNGFVQNGDVVDLSDPFVFGFTMTANTETKKDLSQLSITPTIIDLDGVETVGEEEIISIFGQSEYRYVDTLSFVTRDIIGYVRITAVVTDVDGKTNTASIQVSVNQPAQPLMTKTFEWYRLGNTQTGLEEYGLYWEKNIKATHAQIKPKEGVTLFKFAANDWTETTTDVAKAALFAAAQESGLSVAVYNNVSTSAGATYDDVIGTVMPDGTLHLIHVTKCVIGEFQTQGYPITISGESK